MNQMYNPPRMCTWIRVVSQKYADINRYPSLKEFLDEFKRVTLSEKEKWSVWLQVCQRIWYIVFYKRGHYHASMIEGLDPWKNEFQKWHTTEKHKNCLDCKN